MNLMSSKWGIAALALVCYVFPLTLGIPLFEPDEGLHASIAQEMVERGDYVTPCLLGEPFYDKPILFTWTQAQFLRLFGMNEVGSRAAGMLFGLLGALTTGLLAARWFDRSAGILATLFYMTMVLPIALVQAAVHDVALVPLANLALIAAWEAHRAVSRKKAFAYWGLVGVALGLSCLAKGLIGVAIVTLVFLIYTVVSKSLRPKTVAGALTAFAVAAVVAGPWFLVMNARHPGYAYYYFVQRHFLGYVTSGQLHGTAPWWFYLPLLLGGALPWIVYLPASAMQWWSSRKRADWNLEQPLTLCWIWLIGGMLFLSLAHSKLVTYLSPIFPSVAVLTAVVWSSFRRESASKMFATSVEWTFRSGALLAPLILPIAMYVCAWRFQFTIPPLTWALGIVITCSHWLCLLAWHRGSPRQALNTSIAVLAVTFVFIMAAVLPHVSESISAKSLAGFLNHRGRLPSHVMVVKERIGSVYFYLDPSLRAALKCGQIREVDPSDRNFNKNLPADTLVVVPDKRRDDIARLADGLHEIADVGHYRIYEPKAPRTARTSSEASGGKH